MPFSTKVNAGKIKCLKTDHMGINYYAKNVNYCFRPPITLTLMASSASWATPTAAQNEATSTVKQEITEGINRYLYSIDKADPTLGKQLFMFHRKPVIHPRGHERDGRRSLKIFMAPLRVKPSANAHKNFDASPAIHAYGNAAVLQKVRLAFYRGTP